MYFLPIEGCLDNHCIVTVFEVYLSWLCLTAACVFQLHTLHVSGHCLHTVFPKSLVNMEGVCSVGNAFAEWHCCRPGLGVVLV